MSQMFQVPYLLRHGFIDVSFCWPMHRLQEVCRDTTEKIFHVKTGTVSHESTTNQSLSKAEWKWKLSLSKWPICTLFQEKSRMRYYENQGQFQFRTFSLRNFPPLGISQKKIENQMINTDLNFFVFLRLKLTSNIDPKSSFITKRTK
jgi:hypothetical protein